MRRDFFFSNDCVVSYIVFTSIVVWFINSETMDAFGKKGYENEAAGFSYGGQVVHGISLLWKTMAGQGILLSTVLEEFQFDIFLN